MAHWNWSTIIAAATFAVLILGLAWGAYRRLAAQNEKQLAEQRRIKREVLGEDPDNPEGPRGPTVREMLVQVIDQTRPLAATVEEHGRRLGKHEERIDLHDRRLATVEEHILRRPAGS